MDDKFKGSEHWKYETNEPSDEILKLDMRGLAASAVQEENHKYVSLRRRSTAFTLDSIIALLLYYLGSKIFGGGKIDVLEMLSNQSFFDGFTIFFTAYCTIPECMDSMRGTPGKYIMGIEVLNLAGQKIGLLRSILRNILKAISAIVIVPLLVGYFNPRKRTLHDIIAGTIVVERD